MYKIVLYFDKDKETVEGYMNTMRYEYGRLFDRGLFYSETVEANEFGKCGVCGNIFYKKRSDADYCSKKCRSVAGVRRFRAKKKETEELK